LRPAVNHAIERSPFGSIAHGSQSLEQGRYDELMAREGLFAALARRQIA
jgi:hypothetical protein